MKGAPVLVAGCAFSIGAGGLFGSMPWLRPSAGMCPRRGTFFSCVAKKRRQKKATPSLRPLRGAKGQTCVESVAGCAVELTALRSSFVQTSTASQFTRHGRFDAHAHPATAPPQAQPAGVGQPNIQTALRAIASLGLISRAQAPRAAQAGPSAAMARVDVLFPVPLWMRRGAQGLADQGSRLSERSETERVRARPRQTRAPQVAP